MTDDKWAELVSVAQKHFSGAKISHEDLIMDTPDGPQKQGTQDVLEFTHPSKERYRVVRENRPVVLSKKEHFTHRAGQSARTEYKFSDTEFSHKIRVYRELGLDDWQEVTLDKLGL